MIFTREWSTDMEIANDNLTSEQQKFQKKAVRFCGIGAMVAGTSTVGIIVVALLMQHGIISY